MLGYVRSETRGEADRLLAAAARALRAEGFAVAGVVQLNTEIAPDRPCRMDLELLDTGILTRISQNLGLHGTGCRLDPQGLETAVGLVEESLKQQRPQILFVNKFGKQEVEGRGFRPLIGRALTEDIPVITGVSRLNLEVFLAFAEGMATEIMPDLASVIAWVRGTAARTAA